MKLLLFWFPCLEITRPISYTKNVFRSTTKHSHCFSLRGILWRGCFSPSSPYLLFHKTSLFFENIVVVTIGTSCCSDGFFLFKISLVDNKKKRQPSMDYLSSQEKFLWRRKTMTIFSLTARGETSKH